MIHEHKSLFLHRTNFWTFQNFWKYLKKTLRDAEKSSLTLFGEMSHNLVQKPLSKRSHCTVEAIASPSYKRILSLYLGIHCISSVKELPFWKFICFLHPHVCFLHLIRICEWTFIILLKKTKEVRIFKKYWIMRMWNLLRKIFFVKSFYIIKNIFHKNILYYEKYF